MRSSNKSKLSHSPWYNHAALATIERLGILACKTICHICIMTARCFLGPVYCSFPEGCTTYAIKQLRQEPITRALQNIAQRLFLCTLPHAQKFWRTKSL